MANYFSLFLTLATLLTGAFWLLEHWLRRRNNQYQKEYASAVILGASDRPPAPVNRAMPNWITFFSSLFPMLGTVLVIRSFLYEAYQIPSGSMMPTLLVGDFILVNKHVYGIKDPIFQRQLLATGKPQRGDVAVFKYPEDPNSYFIKRIVGLPGDRVIYRGKRLFIQPAIHGLGKQQNRFYAIDYYEESTYHYKNKFTYNGIPLKILVEQLGSQSHSILINPHLPESSLYYQQPGQPIAEWVVPAGHYFSLGDNRDNSRDSRFWGFIPEQNLVGKAVAIWMSFEKEPETWPTGVRLHRIGPIQ